MKRITFESVVNSIGSTYTFLLALNSTNVGRLAIYFVEKFAKIKVKKMESLQCCSKVHSQISVDN